MRIALRNDKELVGALLPVCLQELTRKENERKISPHGIFWPISPEDQATR